MEYKQLVAQIDQSAVDLGSTYQSEFLDASFCNRLALVMTDKLLQYQSQSLEGIALTLGLSYDMPSAKLKICEQIVNHYTRRLNLINLIQQSMQFVSNRVYALTTGPICAGNPNIFDPAECSIKGGIWQAKVVLPDPEVAENKEWYNRVAMLQKTVMFSVNRLLGILKYLQGSDSSIDDKILTSKQEEVEKIIGELHLQVATIYNDTILLKTYTKIEVAEIKKETDLKQQQQAANQAQLRAAHGLPVVK